MHAVLYMRCNPAVCAMYHDRKEQFFQFEGKKYILSPKNVI